MVGVVIPPVSDCFMPTLGAAQIVAHLKQQGAAAKLYDLGAELQSVLMQQEDILADECAGPHRVTAPAVHRYETIANALFGDESVPFSISYDRFVSRWDWKVPNDLSSLLTAHEALSSYIEQLPSFAELASCDYVAFSVSFDSQIIPALLIAARLRQYKDIPVIFGGSFFYTYANTFSKLMSAIDIVDCLIVGPGETIMAEIARSGIQKTADSHRFETSTLFGKTILQQKHGEQCPDIYIPDFTDLDFTRYLSPVHAFPYMIRNVCYYGGCRFCNGDRDCGAVQSKHIRRAFRSMARIVQDQHISNVYIVDAALSSHDFRMISSMNIPVAFSWIANARFEQDLLTDELVDGLRRKGCFMLRFGLESGSQRVLDLMNKGIEVPVAASILRKLHEAGILTHVYLMLGYLGETHADRLETLRFLEQNRRYISSYSMSVFQPMPGTPVYEEILSKLPASIEQDTDEEYKRIISEVYPSEAAFKDILNTIEHVKSVLSSYAQTNAEFYSANIFSEDHQCTKSDTDLSIQFTPDRPMF